MRNIWSYVRGNFTASQLFDWWGCYDWKRSECDHQLHPLLFSASQTRGDRRASQRWQLLRPEKKNNFFLWYLAWRIMMNLHNTILYSFLIAGHTKFGPDHCFGRIKKSYKLLYVSPIYELASLVEKSSTTGNNKAQIVGTHDGRVIVPVYTTGRPFWNHTLRKSQMSKSITISDFQRPLQEWLSAKS